MKRLLLIVSAFLMPYFIYAQVNGIQFIPPSAASLMKVADFPVGSNNGIPEISLPLHTLSSGNLSLDLTLNFNIDSYLQANQLPDSPGAGWSLSSDIFQIVDIYILLDTKGRIIYEQLLRIEVSTLEC